MTRGAQAHSFLRGHCVDTAVRAAAAMPVDSGRPRPIFRPLPKTSRKSLHPAYGPRLVFHPAVAAWFETRFAAATTAQADAWPLIKAGRHTLIAAPTGSGKTLAAFMAAIDDLVRQGIAGELLDETQVVYVSPLKALSNDIQRNLEAPLAGIREELRAAGIARRRDPDVGSHRRYPAKRTPAHGPPAAPYRRHYAGIALHPSRLGIGPQDAGDHPDRDRRRDPCRRPQQARQPSCAVSRAARRPLRRPSAAHRTVGHAESHRRGRALPGRRQRTTTAPSSIPVIGATAISPSTFPARRSKP